MDNIKAKIIELIPYDFGEGNRHSICGRRYCSCESSNKERQITLADVLRAMEKISDETRVWMGVLTTGQMFHNSPHNDSNAFYQIIDCTWNLTTDYDGQTQEMKDLIGKLIGAV